jgi:hypothetical protein
MIRLDHMCLGVPELADGVRRLAAETGLGSYEGGVFEEHGLGNTIFPLGGDVYVEVEAVVDPTRAPEPAGWFGRATRGGLDQWMFWSLRTDTLEELHEVAERLGGEVARVPGRTEPNGGRRTLTSVPGGPLLLDLWRKGLPNWYYRPDPATNPARRPVSAGSTAPANPRTPVGVAWIEVCGDEKEIVRHVGEETFERLPLRVVGGDEPGLLAVAVRLADGAETVIRRCSAAALLDRDAR